MIGRVMKAVSGSFEVAIGSELICVSGRGKLKRDDKIVVGDVVSVENGAIERVLPRKNILARPTVANVDKAFIVIAPTPTPDFLLVDKLIIICNRLGIETLIVINKCDLLNAATIDDIQQQYANAVSRTIVVSAVEQTNIDALRSELDGKMTVLAGQSAVGKSSLINLLADGYKMETGDVSARSGRGRHTTRHAELFRLNVDTYLIDTPGFSLLDHDELTIDDCDYYYEEFFQLSNGCRYNRCTHTSEPNCAVKDAVQEGALHAARYERYIKLRRELTEKADKKYK